MRKNPLVVVVLMAGPSGSKKNGGGKMEEWLEETIKRINEDRDFGTSLTDIRSFMTKTEEQDRAVWKEAERRRKEAGKTEKTEAERGLETAMERRRQECGAELARRTAAEARAMEFTRIAKEIGMRVAATTAAIERAKSMEEVTDVALGASVRRSFAESPRISCVLWFSNSARTDRGDCRWTRGDCTSQNQTDQNQDGRREKVGDRAQGRPDRRVLENP